MAGLSGWARVAGLVRLCSSGWARVAGFVWLARVAGLVLLGSCGWARVAGLVSLGSSRWARLAGLVQESLNYTSAIIGNNASLPRFGLLLVRVGESCYSLGGMRNVEVHRDILYIMGGER